METDGGGWTLVDNDAVDAEVIASREAGANADITMTRGSVLPAYAWSAAPQLMQRSGSHSRPAAAHVQCTDTHPPRRQPQPLNLRVQSLPQAHQHSV